MLSADVFRQAQAPGLPPLGGGRVGSFRAAFACLDCQSVPEKRRPKPQWTTTERAVRTVRSRLGQTANAQTLYPCGVRSVRSCRSQKHVTLIGQGWPGFVYWCRPVGVAVVPAAVGYGWWPSVAALPRWRVVHAAPAVCLCASRLQKAPSPAWLHAHDLAVVPHPATPAHPVGWVCASMTCLLFAAVHLSCKSQCTPRLSHTADTKTANFLHSPPCLGGCTVAMCGGWGRLNLWGSKAGNRLLIGLRDGGLSGGGG